MEYFQFSKATPKPCLTCNRTEVRILQREFEEGMEDFWIYHVPAYNSCDNCDQGVGRKVWRAATKFGYTCLCPSPIEMVCIPIKTSTVGVVERAIHSSSVGEKGSEYRAHGTFISHLVGVQEPELYKQALTAWAPTAMMGFANKRGVRRELRLADFRKPPHQSTRDSDKDSTTVASPISTVRPEEYVEPANVDVQDGKMLATQLKGDEYGEETRVTGDVTAAEEPKKLATQIGPDIIPTEVMGSTMGNLQAAMAKRVQPLPFHADKHMVRKIEKTVSVLIDRVFSKRKISIWRENNPCFQDMKSSKWSTERWGKAWDEALSEAQPRIEQTFQIKTNEALPAKGKAPRAIIQSGDRAQVMMKLPVKCFEELLFDYFESASIKHLPKHDAMGRVAEHLRQENAHLVEGDGSAWDACCNSKIRKMTENRIIEHIIKCLGGDAEVPDNWLNIMLNDMEKLKIKGKAKVTEYVNNPVKVCIQAIRQSGHAGTSCFNYLINLVCWLCVLADDPWNLIFKDRSGRLATSYVSSRNLKTYSLKYAFEGDDSALSTTEELELHSESIEKQWRLLGFRMKLVYVKEKMTFTGFDFLCDAHGPTDVFIPEISRNIASSAWSCSSELKMHPDKIHQIGAAAMLARAVNFKACGPYSRYFAAIGLAHARRIDDFGLGETEALRLGIHVSPSVKEDLQVCYDSATLMSRSMQRLVDLVAPFPSREAELRMLNCDFGMEYDDHRLARELVPFTVWDPSKFERARR